MEKLINIVKNGENFVFVGSDGEKLPFDIDIANYILKRLSSKKDGKMILTCMSQMAYERAKQLLDDESARVGIDYGI